jgi:hypothetical protein
MDKLVDKNYNKDDFKPAGKAMVNSLAGAGAAVDGQQPADP